MHVAHRVQQPGHLLLAGLDDVRIGVAGGGDAKRGGQIQIFFPVGVPNENTLGAFPDNRPRTVGFEKGDISRLEIPEQLQNLFCFGHEFTIYDLRASVFSETIVNRKSQIINV